MRLANSAFLTITVFLFVIIGQVFYQKIINHQWAQDPQKISQLEEAYQSIVSAKDFGFDTSDSKVVVFYFWAPWCSVCLSDLPSLVELRKTFSKEDIMIYSFATDHSENQQSSLKIKEKYQINFPIINDRQDFYFEKFLVYNLPTTIVYKNGRLIDIKVGAVNFISKDQRDYFTMHLTR